MTKFHEELDEEVGEAEWMIEHALPKHAVHALAKISSLADNGQYSCPADELSHVRVYLDFNETHKAEHSIEEGETMLPDWEEKTLALKEKNSTYYPGLEQLLAAMHSEVDSFNEGNLTAAREHSLYVEQNGFC